MRNSVISSSVKGCPAIICILSNMSQETLNGSEADQEPPRSCFQTAALLVWSRKSVLGVRLRPGVSPVNYLSYLIFLVGICSAFYYLDITLIFLLRHPDYYALSESSVIETIGNLVFYRSLVRIVLDPISGSIHDLISRKTFLAVSVLVVAPAFIFIPRFCCVYPHLLLLTYCSPRVSSHIGL